MMEATTAAAAQTMSPLAATQPGEGLLEATGINQFYGQSHTLWDAGLVVPKNTVVCLMGRNGVGKTT